MDRKNLIIIEGPQGAGKTTLTNLLREKLKATNLIRMSGVDDKTTLGKEKSFTVHEKTLELIARTHFCSLNYVLDRSFISEVLYCELGLKPYSARGWQQRFSTVMQILKNKYNLRIILLKPNEELLKERLQRNKHEYESFSVESSMNQLKGYETILENKLFNGLVETFDCDLGSEEIANQIIKTI